MDALVQLISQLEADGEFDRLTNSVDAQFGTPSEVFIGAGILPERGVPGNIVENESLRYRPVVANDAARYSPVQLKESALVYGHMLAKLAESDIGKEFTAEQYDQTRKLLLGGNSMEARARLLGWLDQEVSLALLRRNEIQRWNCLELALVTRLGDNGYLETVAYEDPAGHRVTVTGDWEATTGGVSDVDPIAADLHPIFEHARDKGVIFSRAITSTATAMKLLRNTHVADRAQFGAAGFIPPNDGILRAPLALPALNSVFQANGFPALEIYDATYWDIDENGVAVRRRYLGEDKIIFIGQSGRDEIYPPEEGDAFTVRGTLGYHAIGTAAGQDNPGRVINVIPEMRRKPPHIDCEGWQTALPILEDPELVYVLDTTV